MKVLVIGSGAREHALLWKLSRSSLMGELYAAPGNGGTGSLARNVPIRAHDSEGLARFAEAERIDLTLVGPEAPLVAGLADLFLSRGLAVLGPTREGAELEGSKLRAKRFFQRHGIPTAPFRAFEGIEEARAWVRSRALPMVIKADGLAAGKGVVVAATREEAAEAVEAMLARREFGEAGARVVIEDCLAGEELSILALVDGERAVVLPAAQDHKRAGEGDRGPNTGGMGAYAPAPLATPALLETVRARIIEPTLRGLAAEGLRYRGVLYFGLMITADGPQVLEINCRFGDPETQAVLPLLAEDLLALVDAAARGSLAGFTGASRPGASICVVLASGGYPGSYTTGLPIEGLDGLGPRDDLAVFHAGTSLDASGRLVTSGGRVLGVTAVARDLTEAAARAYEAVSRISFPGMIYRRDIGARAMGVTRSGATHS
jgi:phosphoribosylamine--glycine ligase